MQDNGTMIVAERGRHAVRLGAHSMDQPWMCYCYCCFGQSIEGTGGSISELLRARRSVGTTAKEASEGARNE